MGRFVSTALCLLLAAGALAQDPQPVPEGPPLAPPPPEALEPSPPAVVEGPDYQKLSVLLVAARRHSGNLRAARHNIAAAEAQLAEAKVSPFFQFTATSAVGVAPDVRGTPIYSPEDNQVGFGSGGWNVVTAADVSGAVPLYTWGKLRAARGAARAGVDAAEGNLDKVLDQLQYDVRRAYFGLQLALDVLQLISEGKGKLQGALERLRRLLEDADPGARQEDVWRLSATIAEIEAREAEARQLEASARAALRALTGLEDVRVIECPSERIDYLLKPLEIYQEAARLNRPEEQMLDAAVRARKQAAEAAESRYFPDLALVLGAGRTWAPGRTDQLNPFAADRANRSRFEAGLAARWSLDIWGNHYRTEKAEAELDATRALHDQANDAIALEVAAAYEQVVAMRATEEAWDRGLRDTRAWFLAATQAYQIGTNEPKDVVEAARAYFQARAAHLEAIRQYNTGLAELERATGVPLRIEPDAWEPQCE